jgi:hypothetical protein
VIECGKKIKKCIKKNERKGEKIEIKEYIER